jgi:hypothetical protein
MSLQTSAKLKNIQKDINVYKLEHYLKSNESLSDQEAFSMVDKLWTAYTNALPLGKLKVYPRQWKTAAVFDKIFLVKASR